MSKYAQGKHAIPRYPRGKHAIERYPLGAHGIAHPASWYIKRGVAKRSMPAMALLLSSSLSAGALSIPLRAVADDAQSSPSVQAMQLASEDAQLVFSEKLDLLIDVTTGKVYDAKTKALLDRSGLPEDVRVAITQLIDEFEAPEPGIATPSHPSNMEDQIIDLTPSIDHDADDADDIANAGSNVSPDEGMDGDKKPAITPDDVTVQKPGQASDASAAANADKVPGADKPAQTSSATKPVQEMLPLEGLDATHQPQDGEDVLGPVSIVDSAATVQATVTELQVASRLLNAGWTPEMIAATLGSMYAESGSNAASYCDMSGMFHYPYEVAAGLFQWTDAGASSSDLSCAGFTGLRQYAEKVGKDWTDVGVQTDYFLRTWRDGWSERQTYYDALHPDYAGVDVSLAAFDETVGGDFDKDGIVDAWDDDVDGDGILNDDDPVTMRVEDGEVQRSKAASAARILPMPATQRTEKETQRHIKELAFAFMAGYEGPAASVAHFDRRVDHALAVYPAVVALEKTRELGIMDSKAGIVVAGAESMLGGTYVWGSESPSTKTFDCSGLTKWCYALVGLGLAHYSESQYAQASRVYDIAEAVPGDILWKPGHVGIYIGNGKTIEAKGVGYGVVYGNAQSFAAALHFDALDEPIR